MIGIQKAVYLRMAGDEVLLNLLGLESADESEISKRLVPTPPGTDMQEIKSLVYFRFPPTGLLSSPLFEKRPLQFRIWGVDRSLATQQNISSRLQEIFVSEAVEIPDLEQYSDFFYIREGGIPGLMFGKFGWSLDLEVHSRVHKP